MSAQRPPRLRPIAGELIANLATNDTGISDAELLGRLEDALAALPAPERAAAMVAFGFDRGSAGVAEALELCTEDAEALSRSALQLLRGALAELDAEPSRPHPEIGRRRRIGNHRPGDQLDGSGR